jgi:predicted RND superfamily exporter protein
MVTERLGKQISRHPKVAIATAVMVTLIAVGCIQLFGIEQEFSEDAFLPQIEIVQASEEISENYTATYSISILVKSKNGDILTSEGLRDMLHIEKAISDDIELIPALEIPEDPASNMNSVADMVAQMALIQQGILVPTLEQKIFVVENVDDYQIKHTIAEMLNSSLTPPEIKGMFSILLTKDFDPADKTLRAKGTIIMTSLNASWFAQGFVANHTGAVRDGAGIEKRMDELVRHTVVETIDARVMGNQ